MTIRDISKIGLFVALMAVMSQIAIPLPWGVPLTMQTAAMIFAGISLGAKNGTMAAVVYVLLGAAGAPVFANFGGGFGRIIGPAGGFILTFPLLALSAGIAIKRQNIPWTAFWLVLGTSVNLVAGLWQFIFVTGSPLADSLEMAILPFLPGALIEVVLFSCFAVKIRNVVAMR